MLAWLGLKTKNFPDTIIEFQDKINKIANDLVKSNLDPKNKNDKQLDVLALQNAKECQKSFIFLSSELEKVFNKIYLDTLNQDVYVGKKTNLQNHNNNNSYDKKELCQELALVYIRHFNLIASILSAVNPANNMCYQRVKALYDQSQMKVNICDDSLYPDTVEKITGIKELLNLYYFYLAQNSVNPVEKERIEKEFDEFKRELGKYMIFSSVDLPDETFGTRNPQNDNSIENEINDVEKEAKEIRDKALNNYASSLTKEQAQKTSQINRKVNDLIQKINELSNVIKETKEKQLPSQENREQLRDDIKKMIDENSRQQLETFKMELSKLQEQINYTSRITFPDLPDLPDLPNTNIQPVEPIPNYESFQEDIQNLPELPPVGSMENQTVGNMENQTVGSMEHQTVGSMENQTVGNMENQTVGNMEHQTVGNMEHQTVGSMGHQTVGNMENQTVGNMENQTVGNMENQTVGNMENQTVGSMEHQTVGNMEHQTVGNMENQTFNEQEKYEQEEKISDDFKMPPRQFGGMKNDEENKTSYKIPENNENNKNIEELDEKNEENNNNNNTAVGRFIRFLREYQNIKKIPEKYRLRLRPKNPNELGGDNFCQMIDQPIDINNQFFSEFKDIVKKSEDHYRIQSEKLLTLLNDYLVHYDKEDDKYQLANLGGKDLTKVEQKARTLLSQYYINCQRLYQDAFKALEFGILNQKKDSEVKLVQEKYTQS